MNQAYKRNIDQRGMTMLSWAGLLVFVGVFVLAIIKLAPLYVEYYTVVSAMNSISEDSKMKGKTKAYILDSFRKRLSINNVESLTKKDSSAKKIKGKKSYLLTVDYSVVKPFIGNISLHVAFQNSVEVGG